MGWGTTRNRRRADAAGEQGALRGGALSRLFFALLGLALLGAGGVYGYQWAVTSPSFALQAVTFDGLERATEGELLRLAALPRGQNLVALDSAQLERSLSQHPWVKQVRVSRRWPATLSVQVVEHVPAALVSLGDLYLVDAGGEPFKRVQPQDGLDLPLLTGIEREAYMERPTESAAAFARALGIARAYAEAGLSERARLSELRLSGDAVALITEQGQEVRLGEGEVGEKLERLARVRGELKRRGLTASIIHLNNRVRPGWVSVQLASERATPPAAAAVSQRF